MSQTYRETVQPGPITRDEEGKQETIARWLRRTMWSALFILVGLVLLGDEFRYLPAAQGADVWDWILLVIGGLLIVNQAARAILHKGPDIGDMILSVICLSLGPVAIIGRTAFAGIVIAMGLYVLMWGVASRPTPGREG